MMDVGTPNIAHGFVRSPLKGQAQPSSPEQPASTCAKEAHSSSPWPCEALNEDLFCHEELVRSGDNAAIE